jgi:hypothetical protein
MGIMLEVEGSLFLPFKVPRMCCPRVRNFAAQLHCYVYENSSNSYQI